MAVEFRPALSPFVSAFCEPRTGNQVTPLVDGADAMQAIYRALVSAKQSVYIADWSMALDVALIREPQPQDNSRVGNVLGWLAESQGVDVRVMLYRSTALGGDLGDDQVIEQLRRRRIQCFSHRPSLKHSHHQKIVIVDGKTAFLGGIDLTAGRWDTSGHPVVDPSYLHERADYYNTTLPKLDRTQHPRLPWHDVHCQIVGPSVQDVARAYVERWNGTRPERMGALTTPPVFIEQSGSCTVQIVRSFSRNSGAWDDQTEASIGQAWMNAVKTAQSFIYIENQYFISNHGAAEPVNGFMNALAERIERAIRERTPFVTVIVLPIMPEGGLLSKWSQQEQMHWQFRTLFRNRDHRGQLIAGILPLWQRIDRACQLAGVNPEDYLSIHALRNWGEQNGQLLTEQIYVHAKTMVVDDRFAIIGSANINDRSFAGDRDSEIGAILLDSQSIPATMGGVPFAGATRLAQELRLKLWREHLGPLSPEQEQQIQDPLRGHELWKQRSRENTSRFLTAFPFIPSDSQKKVPADGGVQRAVPATDQARAVLSLVRGQIVDWPKAWLEGEDLETTGLPDDVFQHPHVRPTAKDNVAVASLEPIKRSEAETQLAKPPTGKPPAARTAQAKAATPKKPARKNAVGEKATEKRETSRTPKKSPPRRKR